MIQKQTLKAAGITILCLVCLAFGQARPDDDIESRPKSVFRVGFLASYFQKGLVQDMRVALEVWGNEIVKKGEVQVERVDIIIFEDEDSSEIHDALSGKNIDCLILNALNFVELEKAALMDPLLVGSLDKDINNEYILLVRHDSGIDSLGGLKNGTINIETESVGRIPLVWLEVLLSNEGLPELHVFFKEVHFKQKASHAVLPVFFGKVTAGVTNIRAYRTMVELNPQLESELSVLMISPPYLRGLVVFRKDLDLKIRDSLLDAMKKIHTDPYGQQILMVLKEHKVVPFKPEYTDTVRTLYKEYQKHMLDKHVGGSEDK